MKKPFCDVCGQPVMNNDNSSVKVVLPLYKPAPGSTESKPITKYAFTLMSSLQEVGYGDICLDCNIKGAKEVVSQLEQRKGKQNDK